MADAKKNILTYAGLQELEAELEDLKVNKRKEVAQKIKEAREQGDLSENAEYDAAKDEQRDIEARIEDIEKILKNVEVVAESDIDDTKINVGCHIIIHDFEYDEDLEFSIVGSTQTNSLSGKISNESPLGHALIGHEVGDIVEVEMGDTVSKYKVLDIKKRNKLYYFKEFKKMAQQNKNEQQVDVNQLLKVRREKLADLQERGKDPFQITKYDVTNHTTEIKDNFEKFECEHDEEGKLVKDPAKLVSIAGRIMLKRVMGKASFCNVQDKTGNIQVYVARNELGDEPFEEYKDFKKMDIGDILVLRDILL